jgi:putative hemolysin
VKGLSKLFFIEKIFTKNPLSIKRAQIHSLIVEAKRAGALEEEERRLMQRVLRLSRKKVKEVMTPRVDVVMVQKDAEFEQILEVLSKNKYSRFPVYGEDADDIVGVLYIKDVLKAVQEKRKFKVMDLARAPYFVPQTKQIGKLLSEFQQKKIHIAIVVDEYGGMSGLVTIEDLLEEIVGEMEDLYEREAPKIKALSNKRFLVDARVPLERLHDELGLHFYTRDYETLGGYVMAKFDRIPKEGESFETREAKIFVKKADKRTLWQLEIVKKR